MTGNTKALTRRSISPRVAPYIILVMLAMVAVPAGITLHTVKVPAAFEVPTSNPTPHGYTVSLLLFIVPIIVIVCWLLPLEGLKIPKRAFWRTIGILVPFGFGLDFFFASRFFFFRNTDATLKISAPALRRWVPIEEYIFYLTGFIAVLLIYIWLSEFWLSAYNVADYPEKARKIRRLLHFHAHSVVLGIALIARGVLTGSGFIQCLR